MLKFNTVLTASLLAVVQGAYAQDVASDEVALDVITVEADTRTETPITETTVSVSVVDQSEIEKQSTANTMVNQLLGKLVPGFSPGTEAASEYGQTLRGRNFLVLIDGVPQNSNTINSYRNLNTISPNAIGQIEVVRGATASYGFGAPGGLVNIVTKRPEDGAFNAQASVGLKFSPHNVGDSLSYLTELGANGAQDGFDYLVDGSFEKTGSSFTADGDRRPPASYGAQGGTDDLTTFNVLAKLGFEHEVHRFEASVNAFHQTQDSDWAGPVSGGSVANNTSATPSRGDLNTKTPAVDNLVLSAKYSNTDVFGSALIAQGYYNDNTTTNNQTQFLGYTYPQYETESQKLGGRLTVDTPFDAGAVPMNLVWGVDGILDHSKINPINAPTGTPEYDMSGIAPFAQLRGDFFERLTVTGGVRLEHLNVDIDTYINELGNTVQGGSLTFTEPLFNISGSFDINETFSVFGGFSQGFQLGNLGRYLYDANYTSVSQLSEDGQKTDSYEIGVRAAGLAWDASLTGFYNESNNGVTYDSNLDIVLSPEEVFGLEFAANADVTDQITIGGTLTWMQGFRDSNNDGSVDTDLPSDRIPPLKLTGYIEYMPVDWASFRLQGLYSGERDAAGTGSGYEPVEAYFLVDAFADFEVAEMHKLSFGVENIFNEDYVPVIQSSYSGAYDDYYYVKGPGTTFSMKYTATF